MDSFLKKVFDGREDDNSHRYFIRFGKGRYPRRFLIKMDVSKKIKIKTSFEWANDLVNFANELKKLKFTGKVLTKDKTPGREGKKKAGSFVYEISDEDISDFADNYYFYLVDCLDSEISLKIKKSLPKPGKDSEKIDDKFCVLELDLKYLPQVRKTFFFDVSEGKKTIVEHELNFNEIIIPANEKDPVKMRENAKRKGEIVRKMVVDGKETLKKYSVEA
ncbi:hypothetical protein COU54_05430 [Candidatus Pacearchaeota archaeon CG10_big_fil_rev_8_21_14_0_10_31_24]|nr:MAG: hypothetical protein COU54_05430 [Candidatus Pacearchaeota archaeon CG10_big_fil_rev_8_21_14_0_10_31_24]